MWHRSLYVTSYCHTNIERQSLWTVQCCSPCMWCLMRVAKISRYCLWPLLSCEDLSIVDTIKMDLKPGKILWSVHPNQELVVFPEDRRIKVLSKSFTIYLDTYEMKSDLSSDELQWGWSCRQKGVKSFKHCHRASHTWIAYSCKQCLRGVHYFIITLSPCHNCYNHIWFPKFQIC